jgi:hypothetical protein
MVSTLMRTCTDTPTSLPFSMGWRVGFSKNQDNNQGREGPHQRTKVGRLKSALSRVRIPVLKGTAHLGVNLHIRTHVFRYTCTCTYMFVHTYRARVKYSSTRVLSYTCTGTRVPWYIHPWCSPMYRTCVLVHVCSST